MMREMFRAVRGGLGGLLLFLLFLLLAFTISDR